MALKKSRVSSSSGKPLQCGNDRPLAHNTHALMAHFAVCEIEYRRNGLDAVARGERGTAVHVDLGDFHTAGLLLGDLVEHRCEHFARTAPFGPKVHKDGMR